MLDASTITHLFYKQNFLLLREYSNALSLPKETVSILTDSLSAIHTLQKFPPDDNIHLITTALFRLQQLAEQGKSIHFMWISSQTILEAKV